MNLLLMASLFLALSGKNVVAEIQDHVIFSIANEKVLSGESDGGKIAALAAFDSAPDHMKDVADELRECIFGLEALSDGSTVHLKHVDLSIVHDIQKRCGLSAAEFCGKWNLLQEEDSSIHVVCEDPPEVQIPRFRNSSEAILGEHAVGSAQTMPTNDPLLPKQWSMKVTGFNEAFLANHRFKGSKDIVVAVLSTGIDYTHKDLRNNIWVNPEKAGCTTPTGERVRDEKLPHDDTVGGCYGVNFSDSKKPTSDPFDDSGHGTVLAGVIGAEQNNGIGIAGVNAKVQLMALKYVSKESRGHPASIFRCIDYAISKKVDVMHNPWGTYAHSDILKPAVEKASEAGILFVTSAGNHNRDNDKESFFRKPLYPCAYRTFDNLLCVASTDDKDKKARHSSYGVKTVQVAAPGEDIISTFPENKYVLRSGTGLAAAMVAGLAAIVKAERKEADYESLKKVILDNVEKLHDLKGKVSTGGRIDGTKVAQALANPILL